MHKRHGAWQRFLHAGFSISKNDNNGHARFIKRRFYGAAERRQGETIMTFKEVTKLTKHTIPKGREAEVAECIKKYVTYKTKLTRGFVIAFSACFVALMFFIIIARSAGLITGNPAAFWAITGVLGAAAVACACVAGVNLFAFNKFLKRFE